MPFAFYEPKRRLGSQGSFELVFGPLDHVIELFVALRKLGNHDGVDRLVVDLGADIRTGWIAQHRGLLVAARWVAVNGSDRRLDGFPSVEIVHSLEGRQIVAV